MFKVTAERSTRSPEPLRDNPVLFSYFHVDVLFVPAALRGMGIGRRLMSQAEDEAVRRSCCGAWLDTFSFQARGFYERLGYTVFRTIEDCPAGHRRFFLKKTLSMQSRLIGESMLRQAPLPRRSTH
jgi:ribosomal protein S18 acetylase RimI-like enzyme